MRKLFLAILAIITVHTIQAQTDSTLQQYVGKYKFPEGSAVTEVVVILDNGVLFATSVMGNAELKRYEGDVFEIMGFNGMASFKRNGDGRISGVRIEVGEIVLEGNKESINWQFVFVRSPGSNSFEHIRTRYYWY